MKECHNLFYIRRIYDSFVVYITLYTTVLKKIKQEELMMGNKKMIEIDILRGISALAVITIHVTANFVLISVFNTLQLSMAYMDWLSQFAVPSFVFISGFTSVA